MSSEPIKNEKSDRPNLAAVLKFSLLILVGFLVFFTFWGMFSDLSSAALSQGKIIVASKRKTIQHKEGGIIREILVKEGSSVNKGETLIILEDTKQRSEYQSFLDRIHKLKAREARLFAELDNSTSITFPSDLLDTQQQSDKINELVSAENEIFQTNNNFYQNRVEMISTQIQQIEKEILGFEAQLKASIEQLELVRKEEDAVRELEARKLVSRPRLLALNREVARIEGEIGKFQSAISSSEQKIQSAKEQLILVKNERRKTNLEQLDKTQQELDELKQKFQIVREELERRMIRSPEKGVVLSLKYHTRGAVVSPGEVLMQIVPTSDQLVIEAMINPLDIDSVKKGLDAIVQITPFKQRSLLQIQGKVTYVSPDLIPSTENIPEHYIAQVDIPKNELEKIGDEELYPGMPVQVMIITGKRSPFEYFFTPIRESFQKAFRED